MNGILKRGPRRDAFTQIPEWILYSPLLSDRAIRLWGILDRHADGDGQCYPGHRRLAELLRCSLDSVRRAQRELESAAALLVEPQFRDDRGQTSNTYTLLFDPPDPYSTPTGGARVRHRSAPVPRAPLAPVHSPPVAPVPPQERESVSNESQLEEPSATAASPPLPGMPSPKAKRQPGPEHAAALVLATLAFAQERKPNTIRPAVVARLEELLAAGRTEEEIRALITSGEDIVWTKGALAFALKQRRKPEPVNPFDTSRFL